MPKDRIYRIFAAISFFSCLAMGFWFVPISTEGQGDAYEYIELAKQFAGLPHNNMELSHKSPLYAFFVAPLIRILGDAGFLKPLILLQFFMFFLSSLLVYKIFARLSRLKWLPVVAASLHLLNLAGVAFAYNVLPETLAQLVFLALMYFLVRAAQEDKNWLWLMLGLFAGVMVLARFNAVGLPFALLVGVGIVHYRYSGFSQPLKFLRRAGLYILPLLLVLNAYFLYNYANRGYYGLFPSHHAGQRWAIPGTINENNTASPEYREVLDIFVTARAEYFADRGEVGPQKGSFLQNKFFKTVYDVIQPSANGYKIYQNALPCLLELYGLEENSRDITMLAEKLIPFYKEIAAQNKKELLRLRLFSLFNTFRANTFVVPVEEDVNLNALPKFVIKGYKLLFFGIFLSVYFIAFFHFLIKIFRVSSYEDWLVLLVILVLAYFPAIHFYANVMYDANAFKFPAESIMTGLFAYYCLNLLYRRKAVAASQP